MNFIGPWKGLLDFPDFFSKQLGYLFKEGQLQITLQGKLLTEYLGFKDIAHSVSYVFSMIRLILSSKPSILFRMTTLSSSMPSIWFRAS